MAPYLTMVEGLKLTALGYNNDNSKLSCRGVKKGAMRKVDFLHVHLSSF